MFANLGLQITPLVSGPCLCINSFGSVNVKMTHDFLFFGHSALDKIIPIISSDFNVF